MSHLVFEMFEIREKKVVLQNGSEIPLVGFGTWPMKGDECYKAVR